MDKGNVRKCGVQYEGSFKLNGEHLMHIVPIKKEHIEGFRKTLDQVAREGKYLLLLKAPSVKSVKRFVLSNIKNKFTQFVVLEADKVIGWCDICPMEHPTTKHIGILGMGLLPEYRGKGIGADLLKKCLMHAKSRGLEIVQLDVYTSNKGAIHLYKKLGFSIEGIRKRARKHKGKYNDLVLMAKYLK